MKPIHAVLATAEGLCTPSDSGPGGLMRWDEVYAVSFSKVDAMTSTITYLTFDYDYGEYVEIHDQMEGFGRLVADLPQYLPIVYPGWQRAMQAALPKEAPVTIYQGTGS